MAEGVAEGRPVPLVSAPASPFPETQNKNLGNILAILPKNLTFLNTKKLQNYLFFGHNVHKI